MERLIKKILRETTSYTNPVPTTATGLYGNVKPGYNFKSRGPIPGRMYSPGFNYESKGPLGVNYFMEDEDEGPNPWAVCTSSLGLEGKKRKDYTSNEKDKYEKCVLSMKKEIKENDVRRMVDRVINEEKSKEVNEYRVKTKTIVSFPMCCLWFCGGCDWTWGGGQWNPPAGSGYVSAGKYANVAPNVSYKRLYNNIKELGEEKVKKGDCGCNGYVHQPGVGKRKAKVCCGDKSHECKKDRDCRNVGSKIDIGKSYNIREIVDRVLYESSHGGSYMAKKQLWGIAEKAQEMAKRLPDDTQLEDWMESHIAKADSMIDSVYDSFDYDNQTEMPGFEGTMDALNNLTIREQETKYRDLESGKNVESSVQLDYMTDYIEDIHTTVTDIQNNLNQIIDLR